MKFYPSRDYTQEEIKNGTILLCADVKCHDCGYELPLAMAGSTDNGKCTKCGGKAS